MTSELLRLEEHLPVFRSYYGLCVLQVTDFAQLKLGCGISSQFGGHV